MATTLTVTLNGNSSLLSVNFFPSIDLDRDKEYVLGLILFQTYNSIPNVSAANNRLYYGDSSSFIMLPEGSYEIKDINNYIKRHLPSDTVFELTANNNTLQSEIKCSERLHFNKSNTLGTVLGFAQRSLEANTLHKSDEPVQINKVNTIRIECNVTTGSYLNDQSMHTIHEFTPVVPPGYKIVEVPRNIIYQPLRVNTIDNLTIKIVDQEGNLVNFRGEGVTVRVHIKEM